MVTIMLRSREYHSVFREREKSRQRKSYLPWTKQRVKVGEGTGSMHLFFPRGTSGVWTTWTVSVNQ